MKILLLQGPLGPFFQTLSQALSKAGHEVYKIHFNGGDECWHCVGYVQDVPLVFGVIQMVRLI